MRFAYRNWISLCLPALLAVQALAQTTTPPQSYLRNNSFVNFESAHVHPLDITPDGAKLLAVNTANNSLEVFSVSNSGSVSFAKSIPVGLDPVTVRARTNSEAWVVNVISDSVSIVDLTNGIVTKTLQTNDEPADVIFAGASQSVAYVSCAQAKTLLAFNATAPTTPTASIVIAGEQPRALAVDKTGRYVYLAIFESGNGTTVLPGGVANGFEHDIVRDSRGPYGGVNVAPNNGNSFKPAFNTANPAPIPVSVIVKRTLVGSAIKWLDDNLKDWSVFISGAFAQNGTAADRTPGWDLVDRDVAILDTTTNQVTYQGGLMNILMAIGVNPATNEITVVGTDATNQIRYEPVLDGTFVRVNFARFTQGGKSTISDLNPHLTYAQPNIPVAQRQFSIGDPRGIVWSADGSKGYVTGMGSNNVVIISNTGARLGLINVGQGPTGIVISNTLAYVLNKFDGSISTVDLTQNAVTATTPLYFDPTPAAIKAGRPILYNTQQTSGLGQASCASCHVDARWDRLAWDLGNPAGTVATLPGATNSGNRIAFHPMKGPLLTQTLIDTMQAPALHWRGDRPQLEMFEGAFQTLMGADNPASQTDINNLRNFLATTTIPPNPNRNLDNSYQTALPILGVGNAVVRTGNAAAGAQEFEQNCRSCHPGHTNRSPLYVDTNTPFGVGIRNPPTWKNFYKRTGLWFNSQTGSTAGFGFQQDGTFDSSHNGSRSDNMMAFMMSMNGGYPYEPSGLNATNWSNNAHAAVGKQVTLNPAVPTDPTGLLPQLLTLADSGVIGLVAKGAVVGQPIRGYMYLGNGIWQSDHLSEVDTTAVMNAKISSGATITFTAVPNESAARIGIDMDGDGILDADDAQPNFANATLTDLARNGTATSVSAYDSLHTAAQAIDGNTIGYFDQNSMLHTAGGNNDWFQEDLGVNAQISLIQLFNRWDCCASRLANVSVFVSPVAFVSTDLTQTRAQAGVKEFFLSGTQGALVQIPMQMAGRYVRVQLNATATPLQLAEVRIMGYSTTTATVSIPAATVASNTSSSITGSISGLTSAPTTLGLGGNPCVNIASCAVNLGGSSGLLNFEFGNVSNTSALLTVYVNPAVQAGTYNIPITIGTTQVGSFTLTVPGTQNSQTITFNAIGAQNVGASIALSATASSGLPVSFSIVPNGNCSLSGSTVTFLNVGNCGVIASQAGNGFYAAAPNVGQVIVINATGIPGFSLSTSASLTLTRGTGGTIPVTITPSHGFSGSVTLSSTGIPTGASSVFLTNSATSYTFVIYVPATVKTGTYPVTINGSSGSITGSTKFNFVVQ